MNYLLDSGAVGGRNANNVVPPLLQESFIKSLQNRIIETQFRRSSIKRAIKALVQSVGLKTAAARLRQPIIVAKVKSHAVVNSQHYLV